MAPSTGATPLFALDAVALDTETTGLDATKVALVQLGAVHIDGGALAPGNGYEQTVNPGIPIPPRAIEIHGITDAMAREAPALADVWEEFRSFLEGRVVIGHSLGFDLAVLAAEAARRGLPWTPPQALCIRMLAMVAAPSLASYSLDTLAGWLDVEIRNRHRALGDAQAAAAIFLALVPRLRDKGIRTLAEAERACLALTPEINRQHEAGWAAPVVEPAGRTRGTDPLIGFDSYAYRHRVGDAMRAPAVVPPETTLAAATEIMVSQVISSVMVATSGRLGDDAGDYAILTERDVLRQVAAGGVDVLGRPVGELASRPVRTIPTDAFLYRAIGRMRRLRLRHLGVRSDDNHLVGVVSARDLLNLRSDPAVALDDAIEEAVSAADMARAWATLPGVVEALVGEEVDARIVCQIVSEETRAMTRHAAMLATRAMEEAGRGTPPCPFAVLVLGSAGRGESLLVPDQDNAIVFESGEPGGTEDRWFAEMATGMAAILDTAGIPFCTGGVMAKNDAWRGSMATWKARIEGWVRRARREDLLNVDIFFDAMPVHGVPALGHTLFEHAYAIGQQDAGFAKRLGETLETVANPFTLFGGLRAENGRLDLKRHALFPIVATARTLAIRHGLAERGTRARIQALMTLDLGSDGDFTGLLDAHELGLALLLAQQSRDISTGLKPSNKIDVAALSRTHRAALKTALRRLQVIPTLVRDVMFARGQA